jgi:hypothetical protein
MIFFKWMLHRERGEEPPSPVAQPPKQGGTPRSPYAWAENKEGKCFKFVIFTILGGGGNGDHLKDIPFANDIHLMTYTQEMCTLC